MRKPKSKQTKPKYLGETDPAKYIHQNKTHRSASEAFRDADYAQAIWKCETEWDRTKAYLIPLLAFIVAGVIIYLFCEGFILWLAN